jgi:uncharacterized protein (DUF1778 family)
VAKEERVTRRRLHNTLRKTILSYYSEEESSIIARAAKKQRMSISNFVATAALKEAGVIARKPQQK